ncbi:MAG: HepT-like ribonuclease domain-containing protein [Aggregatilineaceae bacterium]
MLRDLTYVLDMLIAARYIQAYMAGIDRAAFEQDAMRQDAVIRRIEIIGEAAKRISAEFQAAHREIPWQQVAGMRNRLIHGYDEVSLAIVWNVVQHDIPALIAQLEPLVPPDEL